MKKVMIIGSGGAGKSTLARKLGKMTSLKVYHLDALYWKPGWVQTSDEEWIKIVSEIIQEDSWIIDGNFGSTMEMRANAAETIIFLDYSTRRCLYGIFKRRLMYYRKSRPDMAAGCKEKLDWEFLTWVAQFKRKKAPEILERLIEYRKQGKEIYHLKSPSETEKFLSLQKKK